MKFQIRDKDFGLALCDAESATVALIVFFAERGVTLTPDMIRVVLDDGTAETEIGGSVFRAV